tara:strand:- start:2253 stop:2675 length:423 start_codon:yes stop_codon:yes gene_type:complete
MAGTGGKREGAGRKPSVSRVLQSEKIVRKKLRGGAEAGWEVLADKYPSLIRAAIVVALGNDETGTVRVAPNVSMLKTLLELMPKVVGTDSDATDSPIAILVERMHARLSAAEADKPAVDRDVGRRDVGVVGGHSEGAGAG